MILKLLKTILTLSIIGGVSFFVVSNNTDKKSTPPQCILTHTENKASKIEYSFKVRGGSIHIFADKVNISSIDCIKLVDIKAVYTINSKKFLISSIDGVFFAKKKIFNLKNNIFITADDVNIKTNEAVIDINKQTIANDAPISGSRHGVHFSGSGFLISKHGKLLLKKAVIKMKK